MVEAHTVLLGVTAALFAAGFIAFLANEFMLAGLCFLTATFVIYLRETRY